jgi:HEAT repeat protein
MRVKFFLFLLVLAIIVAGCATTQNRWQKTESTDTIKAYEDFLKENPESSYAEKAKQRIRELRYNQAVKENTRPSYHKFVEDYPEGRFTEDVLSRLKKLTRQEQVKAFRSIKAVRIIVNQSYEKAKDVSLPFEDWTAKLLKNAGLKVVGTNAKRYGALIRIKAAGKPLGAVYSLERYEYAGASLSGTISFEIPNIPSYKESFKATIKPPDKIGSVRMGASDAPFWEAFRAQGSFLPKIFEIMGEYFGNKPLIEAIKDGSLKIKLMPAVSLENINDSREIKQLIASLKDERQGANTADALVKIGKSAVKPLITALKDKNKEIRKNAARALGEIKDRRAVKPLIAALEEEDKEFREIVVEALGRIKDPRVIETLVFILNNKDEDENIRWKAAAALSRMKDPRSVEPLITALKDKSRDIRGIAAAALGEIKDSQAVEPLINALEDKDKSVRRNAAVALKKVTGEDLGDDPKKWKKWWKKNKIDSSI